MMFPAAGIALTVLLAGGFAAAGEVVLRRRSAGVLAWNEAFLVGAGCSAGILFPLSLLLRTRALDALLILLGLAAVGAAVSRIRRRPGPPAAPRVPRGFSRADVALLVLIAAAFATFVTLSFRYTLAWDGFMIFATKAKRLFYEGGLTRAWFPEDVYDRRLIQYPPLLSMYEAMLARLFGGFDFDAFRPLFPLFYGSLLLSTFAAVRARASRRVALWTVLIVAVLPELATTQATAGFSDMPQAAFVAGAVASCLRRESRAAPFLIGSLAMVKPEGTLLAVIASGAVLWVWSSGGIRCLRARLKAHAPAVAIGAAFLGTRVAFVRWLEVQDATYAAIDAHSLARAAERFWYVVGVCARLALDPAQWGFFWPAALAGSLVLLAGGTRNERGLALAVCAAVAADSAIFLFTNWDVAVHARQAYSRLLSQIAPAAAVALALSYWRLRRRYEPERDIAAARPASPFAEGAHVRP